MAKRPLKSLLRMENLLQSSTYRRPSRFYMHWGPQACLPWKEGLQRFFMGRRPSKSLLHGPPPVHFMVVDTDRLLIVYPESYRSPMQTSFWSSTHFWALKKTFFGTSIRFLFLITLWTLFGTSTRTRFVYTHPLLGDHADIHAIKTPLGCLHIFPSGCLYRLSSILTTFWSM